MKLGSYARAMTYTWSYEVKKLRSYEVMHEATKLGRYEVMKLGS